MDTQLYKSVEDFGKKFPKILKEDDLLFLLSLSSFQEKFKTNNFDTEDVKSFIIALSTNFETDIFYNAIVASIKLNSDSDKSDVFIEVMNEMNDEQKINELRENIKVEWDNFKNGQTLSSVMNLLTDYKSEDVESERSVESISEDESQTNDLENESLFRGPDDEQSLAPETQDETSAVDGDNSVENDSQNVAEEETEGKSQEKVQETEGESQEGEGESQEGEGESQEIVQETETKGESLDESNLFNNPSESNESSLNQPDESQSDDEETEKQRNVYESNLFDEEKSQDKSEKETKTEKGGKISRKKNKKNKKSKKINKYF
jgi:hypothetical protein